jgi:hypothetical protein
MLPNASDGKEGMQPIVDDLSMEIGYGLAKMQ